MTQLQRGLGAGAILICLLMCTNPTSKSLAVDTAISFGAPDAGERAPGTTVDFSAEPQCSENRNVDQVAVEPGTDVLAGGIVIRLLAADYVPGTNSLTAEVKDREGEPVSDAMVFVTIRMPAMDHGVSAYPSQETSRGRYQSHDVSLGMEGAWIVTVEVIRQARSPAVATFGIEVQ